MEIKTKHNIGESLIHWNDWTGNTKRCRVKYIFIEKKGDNYIISYRVTNDWFGSSAWKELVEEKFLFKTKEELLQSL